MPLPSATIFTVSHLNTTVSKLLEMEMGQIWLSAEISNFSRPASGHWYFSLKDEGAQVRCAMFLNSNRHVTFPVHNGQHVLVRATITLYEPRGDYQLIIENIQPNGTGMLQQQFEQLKQRLETEGLFDQQYKQRLPEPAQQIGVITSVTGAALYDILRVLQRREPLLSIVIYPAQVQGAEAPASLIRALKLANQRAECDLLIIGRGGGSLEDLWSFNDEQVARAIFASQIPIVSAVGHETDVTIADFVADLRAPTPSSAAELVSRNQVELLRHLQSRQQRMEMAIDYSLAQKQHRFTQWHHRLQQQHPQLQLARQQTSLFKLRRRLDDAIQLHLRHASRLHKFTMQRLLMQSPQRRIHHVQQQYQQCLYRLSQSIQNRLNDNKQLFATFAAQLEGVSPLATLARGFSLTTDTHGKILKNPSQLHSGDIINTRLSGGWIVSEVKKVTASGKHSR